MYTAAVLEVTRDLILNSALSKLYKTSEVQITIDERPFPIAGKDFITIHPMSSFNPIAGQEHVSDRLMFGITVIARTRYVPSDKLGETIYMKELASLEVKMQLVKNLLSRTASSSNVDILNLYNSKIATMDEDIRYLLESDSMSIIDQYTYVDSDSAPTPRFPDFFSAKDGVETISERPAGHSLTARFRAPTAVFKKFCWFAQKGLKSFLTPQHP